MSLAAQLGPWRPTSLPWAEAFARDRTSDRSPLGEPSVKPICRRFV